uniref:Zinc finger protein 574-like n=1 Tax=Geotrypetes seraphini TaxID=260995 RepID=A0A6P8SJV9_GEOSA|nr:zinc finger protein 574-like [Geotrypetes seraphini]
MAGETLFYVCSECGQVYCSLEEVLLHQQSHLPQQYEVVGVTDPIAVDSGVYRALAVQEGQYQCLECGQLLLSPGELLEHQDLHLKLLSHEPQEGQILKTKPESSSGIQFECVDCKALFNTQEMWLSHRQTHLTQPSQQIVFQRVAEMEPAASEPVQNLELVSLTATQGIQLPADSQLLNNHQYYHAGSSPHQTLALVDLEHSYKKNDGQNVSAEPECTVELLLYKCSECTQLFQSPNEYLEHQATHFTTSTAASDTASAGDLTNAVGLQNSGPACAEEAVEQQPGTEICSPAESKELPLSLAEDSETTTNDHSYELKENAAGCGVKSPNMKTKTREEEPSQQFHCADCKKSFAFSHRLQLHLQSHREGSFKCPLCSKAFPSPEALEEHLGATHSDESLHLCVECGLGFSTELILFSHRHSHSSDPLHTCDCGKTFINMTKFLYHRRSHTGKEKLETAAVLDVPVPTPACPDQDAAAKSENSTGRNCPAEGAFRCSPCGKEFPRQLQLLRHQHFVHILERQHKCQLCGKMFKKKSHLHNHQLTHTGERPFHCKVCSKTFASQANLLRHQLTHTGEKPYRCELCSKAFTQSSTLQQHRLMHGQHYRYKCQECGVSFMRRNRFLMHCYHHTGEYPYKCQQCQKSFLLKRLLEVHMLSHQGLEPLRCPICGAAFVSDLRLQEHKCSPDGHKFECMTCGKKIGSAARLKAHEQLHSGEKQTTWGKRNRGNERKRNLQARSAAGLKSFECPDCHKMFSTETSLHVHRRIHTGERPYPCPDCGKAFRQSTHLKDHRRLHTGEKPFKCEICGKAFTIAMRLSEHRRIHTGERPYICAECGKAYRSFSNLWKHRKVHRSQLPAAQYTNNVAILERVEALPVVEAIEVFRCAAGYPL